MAAKNGDSSMSREDLTSNLKVCKFCSEDNEMNLEIKDNQYTVWVLCNTCSKTSIHHKPELEEKIANIEKLKSEFNRLNYESEYSNTGIEIDNTVDRKRRAAGERD